jgi:uncharacterized protein YqfB (UPF0267 family)
MKFKKIRNIKRIEDDTYVCTIEILAEQDQEWVRVPYVANKNDNSEISLWIFKQLAIQNYKIEDQRV